MKNHSPSSASHRAELNRSPDLDAQSHRVGQSWWLHSVTSPKTVMLAIALELSLENVVYEDLACKFFEHFVYIAAAMDRIGDNEDELWDEDDGFFYDVLKLPGGDAIQLKVRSMVGLIPLFASAIFERSVLDRLPAFAKRVAHFVQANPALMTNISNGTRAGVKGRYLLSPVNEAKLRRILGRMTASKSGVLEKMMAERRIYYFSFRCQPA